MPNVSHLECGRCGRHFVPGKVYNLCDCGSPLLVRYDLKRLRDGFSLRDLAGRAANLWRYREVLPVGEEVNVVCLGEGFTPLLHAKRLGEKLGLPKLYLKDESFNPRSEEHTSELQSPMY